MKLINTQTSKAFLICKTGRLIKNSDASAQEFQRIKGLNYLNGTSSLEN